MRAFFPVALILLISVHSQARPGSLELPSWGGRPASDRKVSSIFWMSGTDASADERDGRLGPEAVEEGSLHVGRMGRTLSGLIASGSGAGEEMPVHPLYDLETYARKLPSEWLHYDPQHLLSEPTTVDLLSFLAYHARESRIPIRVVLFAPGDNPRGLVDLQSLCDSWSEPVGVDGCMVAYYLGRPDRAELYFPTWSVELLSFMKSGRAVEKAVKSAQVVQNEISQLDRFGVALSMEIFRAQKMLETRAGDQLSSPVVQVRQEAAAGEGRGGKSAILVAAFLGLGVGIVLLIRGRARVAADEAAEVFLFDDFETPVRLGGEYAGGAGAVAFFADKEFR